MDWRWTRGDRERERWLGQDSGSGDWDLWRQCTGIWKKEPHPGRKDQDHGSAQPLSLSLWCLDNCIARDPGHPSPSLGPTQWRVQLLGCGPPPWGGKSLGPRGTCPRRLCSRYLGSPRQNSRYPRISPGTPQAPAHCQDLHGLLPQIWPPLGARLWGCGQGLERADWGVHTYVQTQHSAGRGWVVERGRQQVVPGCDLPSFESSIPFPLPMLQHYQATQHPDTEWDTEWRPVSYLVEYKPGFKGQCFTTEAGRLRQGCSSEGHCSFSLCGVIDLRQLTQAQHLLLSGWN